jgi:hypothetical protein
MAAAGAHEDHRQARELARCERPRGLGLVLHAVAEPGGGDGEEADGHDQEEEEGTSVHG